MEEVSVKDALIFIIVLTFKFFALAFCFGIFGQLLLYNQIIAFIFAGSVLLLIAAA